MAVILSVIVALVIIGGIQSITKVSERLVPFMAAFYVLGCLIILIMNADVLGQSIGVIVSSAFTAKAVGGGFVGSTIATACRYGFARGLFSNESGMGSAPLVASAAQTRNPKRQAMVSMTGTFWDTVVICLMTGLVLVSSIIKHPSIDGLSGNGSELTSLAFGMIPYIGVPILVVGLITFAFSTILGWLQDPLGDRHLRRLPGGTEPGLGYGGPAQRPDGDPEYLCCAASQQCYCGGDEEVQR